MSQGRKAACREIRNADQQGSIRFILRILAHIDSFSGASQLLIIIIMTAYLENNGIICRTILLCK